MELILLQPFKNLGNIGDIVCVKGGYGRNYLLPQGIALRATKQNKATFEQRKKVLEQENLVAKNNAEILAKKVNGAKLTFIRQASEDGKLFGSITNKQIANEINRLHQAELKQSQISLNSTLKNIGIYTVEISLHHSLNAQTIVNVARSEIDAQKALQEYENSTTRQQGDKES